MGLGVSPTAPPVTVRYSRSKISTMPLAPASTTCAWPSTSSWPVVSRSASIEQARTASICCSSPAPSSAWVRAVSAIACSTVSMVPWVGSAIAVCARWAASSIAEAKRSGVKSPSARVASPSSSATPRRATAKMRPELPRAPRRAPAAIASTTRGRVAGPSMASTAR